MTQSRVEQVGRYQIREELGVGAYATVYRAHDPVLRRDVALKLLHAYLAHDPAVRRRFVREGHALAGVHQPNIVQVYDAGETDETAYLAMELVEGESLDAVILARGPLPLADTAPIVAQVAAALAAVHARGLVHRDVKPENIMLEPDTDRVVLLDFGIARALETTTVTTGLVGTPAFMAPEQIEPGGRVSARTDVYQLGATLFAMLTGEPPFSGDVQQLVYEIVHRPPPDVSALRPDIPPAVARLVSEAMAKEPAERPASARVFAERLHELAEAGLQPAPLPYVIQPAAPVERPPLTEAATVHGSSPAAQRSAPDGIDRSATPAAAPLAPRPAPPPAWQRPNRDWQQHRPRRAQPSQVPLLIALAATALAAVLAGGALLILGRGSSRPAADATRAAVRSQATAAATPALSPAATAAPASPTTAASAPAVTAPPASPPAATQPAPVQRPAPTAPAAAPPPIASPAAADQSQVNLPAVAGEWLLTDTIRSGPGEGSQFSFRIRLAQQGARVSGTGDLVIEGRMDGRTLRARYRQGSSVGDFVWTFSADGTSFAGTFTSEGFGNAGESFGRRVGGE